MLQINFYFIFTIYNHDKIRHKIYILYIPLGGPVEMAFPLSCVNVSKINFIYHIYEFSMV